jgi:hypothetical protein
VVWVRWGLLADQARLSSDEGQVRLASLTHRFFRQCERSRRTLWDGGEGRFRRCFCPANHSKNMR